MKRAQKYPSIKQYEGHLKRLINVKQEKPQKSNHFARNIKGINKQGSSLPMRRGRLKTEGERINKKSLTPSNLKLPCTIQLPLVPLKERQLISKSLETAQIHSREAELLLENYLLSRRIIKTKPCIKSKEFQKSFKSHQKYSRLRSKSRLLAANLSQSRLEKFKQFTITQKNRQLSKSSHGSGRYCFKLHIKQLQTIIRSNGQGKLYNLQLNLGRKTFKYSNLSLTGLKSTHSFHFKKKHALRSAILYAQIETIVHNQIYKYAEFSIDLSKPFGEIRQISKYRDYLYHNTSEINQLKSMRSDQMVGTVLYDYWIFTIGAEA